MRTTIQWALFLRVSNRAKADKLSRKFIEAVGLPTELGEVERYWKDEALYTRRATSALEAASPPEACYAVMNACSRLARSWRVSGVEENAASWELQGTMDPGASKIQGIEWASFVADAHLAPVETPTGSCSHTSAPVPPA